MYAQIVKKRKELVVFHLRNKILSDSNMGIQKKKFPNIFNRYRNQRGGVWVQSPHPQKSEKNSITKGKFRGKTREKWKKQKNAKELEGS